MITAVDTNVLLDILIPQAAQREASERALTNAARMGALVLSEPVYAELAALFPGRNALDLFLSDTGIRLDVSKAEALFRAGRAWREYRDRRPAGPTCPRCGNVQEVRCGRCAGSVATRQHVVADFMIGAHALVQANRLITRDRGYYATYFPQLALA